MSTLCSTSPRKEEKDTIAGTSTNCSAICCTKGTWRLPERWDKDEIFGHFDNLLRQIEVPERLHQLVSPLRHRSIEDLHEGQDVDPVLHGVPLHPPLRRRVRHAQVFITAWMCTFHVQDSMSPCFVSIGCCTRHSSPATKLIPIRFISFHILSLVNSFVPMSATFDSVETCFVANFFSSMACSKHPAVVPCHDSQQSHSGAQVSSSSLSLRDRCVSSTDLSMHRILVHRTTTLLTTRP